MPTGAGTASRLYSKHVEPAAGDGQGLLAARLTCRTPHPPWTCTAPRPQGLPDAAPRVGGAVPERPGLGLWRGRLPLPGRAAGRAAGGGTPRGVHGRSGRQSYVHAPRAQALQCMVSVATKPSFLCMRGWCLEHGLCALCGGDGSRSGPPVQQPLPAWLCWCLALYVRCMPACTSRRRFWCCLPPCNLPSRLPLADSSTPAPARRRPQRAQRV